MPYRRLRIVLIAWAIVLPLLGAGALAKRSHDHRRLRSQMVEELTPLADHGPGSYEREAASVAEYLSYSQGKAIYLLNRGYASPELLRSLLLCEARRCYDWKYLYTSVNNYDLRTRPSQ
jgi:hypothetical protein